MPFASEKKLRQRQKHEHAREFASLFGCGDKLITDLILQKIVESKLNALTFKATLT